MGVVNGLSVAVALTGPTVFAGCSAAAGVCAWVVAGTKTETDSASVAVDKAVRKNVTSVVLLVGSEAGGACTWNVTVA